MARAQKGSACEKSEDDPTRLHCRCFAEKDFMGTGLSRRQLLNWPQAVPFHAIDDLKEKDAPTVIGHYSQVFNISPQTLCAMENTVGSLNIEILPGVRDVSPPLTMICCRETWIGRLRWSNMRNDPPGSFSLGAIVGRRRKW